jgi:hypothetical protein
MIKYCVCGHSENFHASKLYGFKANECRIMIVSDEQCGCWKFKLDNLKLIEDLAKEKNLI